MRFALRIVTGAFLASARFVAAQQAAPVSGTVTGSVIDPASSAVLPPLPRIGSLIAAATTPGSRCSASVRRSTKR